METQVMNVLIGAVTGLGGTALAKETLSAAAEEMRKITIADSKLFDGITDGETTLSNTSGVSAGGKWDLEPKKTGGTRGDLDGLCGKVNERCKTTIDAKGNEILDLKDGMVQWNKEGADGKTLAAFLESPEGQKMAGATGGIQGMQGTLFGEPYAAGSWQDKLIEAFGGTHDHIGGKVSGLYDEQGNARREMTKAENTAYNIWAAAAIVPSAPFAMATLLPPEVWKAISILLGAAK
jgi:filamentous hemagglutinin